MVQEGGRYERNPDFIYREIVGEAVLVPVRQQAGGADCLYTLNAVGTLVWQKLAAPATEAELHGAILDAFEIDAETAAADLDRFLQGLLAIDAVRAG